MIVLDNLFWFIQHYPRYASHLRIQTYAIGDPALLFKLKDHLSHADVLKNLSSFISNQYDFDDILFYKNHFDITNEEWPNILIGVVRDDPLSPGSLCILKHKDSSLPLYKILPVQLHWESLFHYSPLTLSQIRPYVTPQYKVYIDFILTIMLDDRDSLMTDFKNMVFPNDFLYDCFLYALTSQRKRISTYIHSCLPRYFEIPSSDQPYICLRLNPAPQELLNLSPDDISDHLYRIKQFIGHDTKELETLLIHLLESGWFFTSHIRRDLIAHLLLIF